MDQFTSYFWDVLYTCHLCYVYVQRTTIYNPGKSKGSK